MLADGTDRPFVRGIERSFDCLYCRMSMSADGTERPFVRGKERSFTVCIGGCLRQQGEIQQPFVSADGIE